MTTTTTTTIDWQTDPVTGITSHRLSHEEAAHAEVLGGPYLGRPQIVEISLPGESATIFGHYQGRGPYPVDRSLVHPRYRDARRQAVWNAISGPGEEATAAQIDRILAAEVHDIPVAEWASLVQLATDVVPCPPSCPAPECKLARSVLRLNRGLRA